MPLEIISNKLQLEVYGFGAVAADKDYTSTAFRLSGRMWELVNAKKIPHKGKNIWIYDTADKVFAGVELEHTADGVASGLERTCIELEQYARYTHVGPYQLIKQSGLAMREQLGKMGYRIALPYIEIYGHWVKDETKLQTDLIMSLE